MLFSRRTSWTLFGRHLLRGLGAGGLGAGGLGVHGEVLFGRLCLQGAGGLRRRLSGLDLLWLPSSLDDLGQVGLGMSPRRTAYVLEYCIVHLLLLFCDCILNSWIGEEGFLFRELCRLAWSNGNFCSFQVHFLIVWTADCWGALFPLVCPSFRLVGSA